MPTVSNYESPASKLYNQMDTAFSLPWESTGGVTILFTIGFIVLFFPTAIRAATGEGIIPTVESFARMVIAGFTFLTIITFCIGIWMWWNELKSTLPTEQSN